MPAIRPGLKVLVVEDDRDGADSLALLLGLYGHRVRVARTGPDGVAAARTDPPDVLICNLHLPGLSGLDVARQVAALPARPLLVAITAQYGEGVAAEARAAGFHHYFVKPVDPDELLDVLNSHPDR
jgi:CheY-like chemotaxis protein